MPVTKLLIGYKTKPAPGYEKMLPEFEGRSGTKDAAKIAQQIAEKKQAFEEMAAGTPYLGTFEDVCVRLFADKEPAYRFTLTGADTTPISARVGAWLLKKCPGAWPWDLLAPPARGVVFLGFEPRLFLKILGLECSMPPISAPLPPRLWFANSDHRDLETALIPAEHKKELSLRKVLERRRPLGEEDGKKWDAMLAGWAGPGHDPKKDLDLATEVAAQLGFLEPG
jgi:hypothetical protein